MGLDPLSNLHHSDLARRRQRTSSRSDLERPIRGWFDDIERKDMGIVVSKNGRKAVFSRDGASRSPFFDNIEQLGSHGFLKVIRFLQDEAQIAYLDPNTFCSMTGWHPNIGSICKQGNLGWVVQIVRDNEWYWLIRKACYGPIYSITDPLFVRGDHFAFRQKVQSSYASVAWNIDGALTDENRPACLQLPPKGSMFTPLWGFFTDDNGNYRFVKTVDGEDRVVTRDGLCDLPTSIWPVYLGDGHLLWEDRRRHQISLNHELVLTGSIAQVFRSEGRYATARYAVVISDQEKYRLLVSPGQVGQRRFLGDWADEIRIILLEDGSATWLERSGESWSLYQDGMVIHRDLEIKNVQYLPEVVAILKEYDGNIPLPTYHYQDRKEEQIWPVMKREGWPFVFRQR